MKVSNVITCHLSTPIYRQSSQSRDEYLEQQRLYFNAQIKNRRSTYKGKSVRLAKSKLPGDECFEKFIYGKEEYHKRADGAKAKPDRTRLERINWIFEILDKYDSCKTCSSFFEYPDKNFKDRINITCYYNKYKIVISMVEDEDEYIVVSAFYLSPKTIK